MAEALAHIQDERTKSHTHKIDVTPDKLQEERKHLSTICKDEVNSKDSALKPHRREDKELRIVGS